MSYPDPRYLKDQGEINATFQSSKQTPNLTIGERAIIRYLATSELTDGRFGLYRWEVGARTPGATPHFHRTISESFFVLSGTVQLFNGERWIDATAGDFLYVPEGGIHGFGNDSDETASMLILFSPGAPREPYFEAIAERVAGKNFSEEDWAKVCMDNDNYFIDEKSRALYQKLQSNK